MYCLIQMKPQSSYQGFISTSYIGVLSQPESGLVDQPLPDKSVICLEKVCAIHEVLVQSKSGMDIQTKYLSNSVISNGVLKFKADDPDILFTRMVEENDEVLEGHKSAIDAFRLEKIRIQRVASTPVFPNQAGQ